MDFRLYNDKDKIFIYISYFLKNAIDQFIVNHSSIEYTLLHYLSIYMMNIIYLFSSLISLLDWLYFTFAYFADHFVFLSFSSFSSFLFLDFVVFYFPKMNNWEKLFYFSLNKWNKFGNKKVFYFKWKEKNEWNKKMLVLSQNDFFSSLVIINLSCIETLLIFIYNHFNIMKIIIEIFNWTRCC